ncbi:protein masquerade-like isoform X2 [Portunus trituberculatus]|uniref:protein masquerade-like isoform X2 n=1 Tax=Portunus trituberculatus TaxID=210409 RepID=UPI001E1D08D0|nr:protein masquerade-like isoform X2 [Portunus trituberculatus]
MALHWANLTWMTTALLWWMAAQGQVAAKNSSSTTSSIPTSVLTLEDESDSATDLTTETVIETTVVTEGISTWGGVIEEEEKEGSPTMRPSTQTTSLSTRPLEEEEDHLTTDIPTTITTTAKAQAYAPSSTLSVCPGVCVADRISWHCEAALDIPKFCREGLRCCVPGDLFAAVDVPPKEFVLLNPKRTEDGEKEGKRGEKEEVEVDESVKNQENDQIDFVSASTTTSTTIFATTTTSPLTTVYNRRPFRTSPRPTRPSNIPPELNCKGTCVVAFFAFICDEVDRSGFCRGSSRCCVSKRQRPEALQNIPEKGSTTRDTSSTTIAITPPTTTTTPSTTTNTRTSTIQVCPGTCLPALVSSFCNQPSVLVEASGCKEGTVCCDDREEKESLQPPPPPRTPPHRLPSPRPPPSNTFDSITTFLTGQSPHHLLPIEGRPVPPLRPRPTMTTMTTTTMTTTTTQLPTTEAPDLREECPGTCIQPFLSFTCFGNAEMTQLFRCTKDKTECCSPKSALRDLLHFEEAHNIARNDTAYIPVYDPVVYPPPGPDLHHQPPHLHTSYQQHPHYDLPTYEQLYEHEAYDRYPDTPYEPAYEQPLPQPSFDELTYPQTPSYEQSSQPQYNQPLHEQQTYDRRPYTLVPNISAGIPPQYLTTTRAPVRNKYVCGVKGNEREARVVGGEDSLAGEWCWQVALINAKNQYLCGGALIGTQWVLTAAHCVTNIVRSGDAVYVRVGDHDLTTKFGSPGAQTLRVATTYIHHNHNSQTLDNDIALLKLHAHADLNEGVCLACLPARGVNQVAGSRCTVTGYGYMGEKGPIPLRVREAEMPVVSDNECVRKINAVTEKIFILPASSFCAGGEKGHDACQGDGGGPLVCKVDGYYELSGLVSWGFGCGRKDVPGVYVKVSSFIGWINQIISVNNM